MLPGVGVFGTGSTVRVLVPLLKAEGFEVHALWAPSDEEASHLAKELGVPFHTSHSDDVLLHQDVDLVCIYVPPSMTRQIAVKALGKKAVKLSTKNTEANTCQTVCTITFCYGL